MSRKFDPRGLQWSKFISDQIQDGGWRSLENVEVVITSAGLSNFVEIRSVCASAAHSFQRRSSTGVLSQKLATRTATPPWPSLAKGTRVNTVSLHSYCRPCCSVYIIIAYILSGAVSKLLQIIGQFFCYRDSGEGLTHLFGVNTKTQYYEIWHQETIALSYTVQKYFDILNRGSRVWRTDERTDGETEWPSAIVRANTVRRALKLLTG